jgi:hypothetical protein
MELLPLPTGMAVLLGIALVVALFSHWRIHRFWRASLVSAAATPAVFLAACLVQAGLPDPLEPLALAYFSGFGFVVAVLSGGLIRVARVAVPVRA